MKIIFVGDVLPEDCFFMLSHVSPSTNNAQLNYIRILQECYPDDIYVVSANILTKYLSGNRLIPSYKYTVLNNIPIITSSFIKNRILLNVSLLINTCFLIKRIRRAVTSSKDKVLFIVNNHFYTFSLPTFLAKKKRDYMITIINEGFDVRFLNEKKKMFRNTITNCIHKILIKHNNGIITFSRETVIDYAPNVPFVSLYYSFDLNQTVNSFNIAKSTHKTILYAGYIDDCYGISEILNAIKRLPDEYKLIICGGGSQKLIDLIKNEQANGKVEYKGMLKREEVIRLEHEVDVLLLIRTQNTAHQKYIAKYCQPSKIPEYLFSKTPILATDIEAIPVDIKQYLFLCDSSPKSIADSILKICNDPVLSRNKAQSGYEFAKNYCSYDSQKKQITNFINKITGHDSFNKQN